MAFTLKTDMLNEQIYHLLKQDILLHRLLPGERLVDSQIAENYGVSRTPVRDALLMLVREGLVKNSGRRGFCVFEATERDIDELYEIREMIETHAIHTLIGRLRVKPEEMKQKLICVQVRSEAFLEEGNWICADESFHEGLVELAGNGRLYKISLEIEHQTRVFRQTAGTIETRVRLAMERHAGLLRSVLLLDEEEACRQLRSHLSNGKAEARADWLAITKKQPQTKQEEEL